jgi:hypothetical protein
MLGIVPIKVIGSVQSQDALYSSPGLPGVAISGRHLMNISNKSHCFIGITFQSKFPDDLNSVSISFTF